MDGVDGFFGNVSMICGRYYLVVVWLFKLKRDVEVFCCVE